MKILVLGGGAREHALAVALQRSRRNPEVLVAPGNGGLQGVARAVDVPLHDQDGLVQLARSEAVDLTIAGSEEPLVGGIWNAFDAAGLRLFGPSMEAAILEGSKVYAKEFMHRHSIPTAPFEVFDDYESARENLAATAGPWVLKADGLAAGKGVHLVDDLAVAESLLHAMLVVGCHGDAGRRVLVESRLTGIELSVFAISDGYTYRLLGCAQDHKRAYDGDQGPNTGGMGAYSPVPFVDAALLQVIEAQILAPTLAGMLDEGVPYRGFLYLGLMLTESGPKLLEYNCRLGDPEAQVLLPRLQSDFLDLVIAAETGDVLAAGLEFAAGFSVGVVVASEGYPASPRKGRAIRGLDAARHTGVHVYCAGVKSQGDTVITDGGRVVTVVGQATDLQTARRKAYDAAQKIEIEGAFYRRDIGHQAGESNVWPSRASAS